MTDEIRDGVREELAEANGVLTALQRRYERAIAQLNEATSTIARVEALPAKWMEQRKQAHGSSFADGCGFALKECASELGQAIRGES